MNDDMQEVSVDTVTIDGKKYISEISILRFLQALKNDTPVSYLILAITQAKKIN